jgi:hypothetical protein
VDQRGKFDEPEGYYEDRYSRERYFYGDHRDYHCESGPSRWSGYLNQRFSEYNHEFNDTGNGVMRFTFTTYYEVKTELGPISLRGTAWAMLELAARVQVI